MRLSQAFSIRYKIALALLATGTLSTMLVVGVAYTRLTHKFDDAILQSAVDSFRTDVVAYFTVYGSWEEAQRHEGFSAFSARRRQQLGLPLVTGIKPPVPPAASGSVAIAPLVAPKGAPLPGENLRRPPFRFYLFDTAGRALLPLDPYRVGDPIGAEQHDTLLPIEANGKILAYFSPEGHIYYSDLDLGYLEAIREAMIYGVAVSIVLTAVLGWAIGTRLSAALRRLTSAIRSMGQGELKQYVTIDSRDEVGMLSSAFNTMSDELVRSHAALRQAHEQLRQQTERLRELSVRDDLTKLHNRRFFDEQAGPAFERARRYRRPFTVAIGDLDGFKRINDEYSHAVGDEVLRRVGGILRARVRGGDLVARLGGEEFAIAFPETPLQQAVEACESVRALIEAYPWHEVYPTLRVTMSIGLCGNRDLGSLAAMLAAADTQLYRAKASGRNRVCSETRALYSD